MNPPATFETSRLRLRPPAVADAAAIFDAYTQDARVARYTSWSPHRSLDETRKFLEQYCEAGWKAGTVFSWLITVSESGQAAGIIDFRVTTCRSETGYVLAQPYWGHGYMTEAAGPVVEWMIAQPEIHRVWATVHPENVASQRVLAKVGMAREGVLRRWAIFPNLGPVPCDVWSFARIKETGSRP